MLTKSPVGSSNESKNICSQGLNVLAMKHKTWLNKNSPKPTAVSSSRKRKSNGITANISTENNWQDSEQFKTMKKSLNNLFRTYSSTKNEAHRNKSIDPHKKKTSSPAVFPEKKLSPTTTKPHGHLNILNNAGTS